MRFQAPDVHLKTSYRVVQKNSALIPEYQYTGLYPVINSC